MIFLISSCDYIIPRKKIVDKAIVTTTGKVYSGYGVGKYVVYVQYLNKKPVEKRHHKYKYSNYKNKIKGFKVGDTVCVYRHRFSSNLFIINNQGEELILEKTNYLTFN